MADKISLITVESLENQTTAVQALNENFGLIASAFDNTFSRDGMTPNTMSADIDVNSRRIINLATPINGTDAARLADIANALAIDDLTLIPAMTGNEDKILSNDGSILYWAEPANIDGLGDVVAANNLSDLDNAATARTNLGLGTAALYDIGIAGAVVPFLSASNTFSGANTFLGGNNFAAGLTFSGTADYRLTATSTALTPESIGFRGAPTATQDTDYTLVLNDAGRMKIHTSGTGHTYTIPTNASVAYPNGTIMLIRNIGAGVVTVARSGGVTLRRAGVATDANASIAQWGFATLVKDDTNVWSISGTGVS